MIEFLKYNLTKKTAVPAAGGVIVLIGMLMQGKIDVSELALGIVAGVTSISQGSKKPKG